MSPHYVPLSDTSHEDEEGFTDHDLPLSSAHQRYDRGQETRRNPGWMIYTALAITLICTVINALQLRWIRGWQADLGQGNLTRRPSTYIGLNRLSLATEESFGTFPILLTQIDRESKSRIYKDDTKQKMTELGVVWPDARRFLIRDSISSVAQFRTVDYGYENCSVAFSLEPSAADYKTVTSIPASPVSVDIFFHLDVPQIRAGTLSYTALYDRPRAARRLHETVHLTSGQEVRGTWFPCPTGTFFTVEISCSQKSTTLCHVEFWDNPKHPKFGLTLTQRRAFISDI